jgi:DNA-binding NarL/FixJ family response regulator
MIIEVPHHGSEQLPKQIITKLDQFKVTPREQQVLSLLVQGCSNREIASELSISYRTVKEHLRMMFLRAGIREGDKRVKLARYAHEDGDVATTLCEGLNPRESQISILVWEGLTNREIGRIVGISENGVKTHLGSAFDKLGVWTRLELAMYVADHGGKESAYLDRAG